MSNRTSAAFSSESLASSLIGEDISFDLTRDSDGWGMMMNACWWWMVEVTRWMDAKCSGRTRHRLRKGTVSNNSSGGDAPTYEKVQLHFFHLTVQSIPISNIMMSMGTRGSSSSSTLISNASCLDTPANLLPMQTKCASPGTNVLSVPDILPMSLLHVGWISHTNRWPNHLLPSVSL